MLHVVHTDSEARPAPSPPPSSKAALRSLPGGFSRCRVVAVSRDHLIGRMALAIIEWVEHHGGMVEGNLTGYGFTLAEISAHKDEALRIAKSFKPRAFRGWHDFGC